PVAALDLLLLARTYGEVEARARAVLAAEGHPADAVVLRRLADLRYAGQAYELTVPAPGAPLSASAVADLAERFQQEHERTYGHRAEAERVELVTLRIVASVDPGARAPISPQSPAATTAETWREAYFGPGDGLLPTPVLARSGLTPSLRPGPLIVEEYDSTTVVPPGCTARLDGGNNIIIEMDDSRS